MEDDYSMVEGDNEDSGGRLIAGHIFWWLVAAAAAVAVTLGLWGFSVLFPPTGVSSLGSSRPHLSTMSIGLEGGT